MQYVTVCNGNFYSLNFTFAENIDDGKVQTAWETLSTLKIKTNVGGAVWDVGSVLIMVLLGLVVVAAVVIAIIIVYSIIRDIKKRRTDLNENSDFIERRR